LADARAVALDALVRIDAEGAYANLVLGPLLDRARLSERDRGFVTTLVYGTTRMRRACDWVVERFLMREVEPAVLASLRMGAFQLVFLDTPAHAAVGATVEVAPKRARGLVNAVLRKVAAARPVSWPSDGVRLSYPDWVIDRLTSDLGPDRAVAALEAMNEPGQVTERPDGYVQDLASQWVAALVGAEPGERVADLAAAPGGKATAMAEAGAWVAASDVRPGRARLVAANSARLSLPDVATVAADGRRPPYRPGTFDRVLLDAPCSGLGALRRRPDARWRIEEDDVERLADLQAALLDAALGLARPGGTVVYSVCTLTVAESIGVDERFGHVEVLDRPEAPWVPWGRGALLLPQAAGTDGMALFRYRAPG
jgi:16S rRNA (cytosine967-C5)-methyltransferase